MATEPKDAGQKAPEQKPVATPADRGGNTNDDSPQAHASKMVGFRSDHVSAHDAAVEANKQVAKDDAAAVKAAAPVDQAAFAPNFQNQVPQEGALVESPPQPVPPSYTEAQLREMDHAPEGLREPSVAKNSTDTDQTVHPKSRVDDPTKPL
jgi:hypothetical protein